MESDASFPGKLAFAGKISEIERYIREMKQWEGKEIANIMNNAIEGWKPHGTHRFGKEYGIQRSWKRMEDSVKKDKDGFMEVPEQLEIPFE